MMVLNFISLSAAISVIVVIIILISVLLVLYFKNKKLKKVLDTEKQKFYIYQDGIKKLRSSNIEEPENAFEILNKYARAFFNEYYQLSYSLTYLELEESFKKQGNEEYARFCRSMSEVDYSGEKNQTKKIKTLVNLFGNILDEFEF